MVSDAKELKEIREGRKKSARVAAFFDLDGTLTPLPSVEQRFFWLLRYRHEIPLRNYFLWLREAMRLLPDGIDAVTQGNKMYLQGVQIFDESEAGNRRHLPAHTSGRPGLVRASQVEGQASATPTQGARRNPRWPVPRFFEDALERIAWHARHGHAIVILSGTLEPLAIAVARTLEAELAARGLAAQILVGATRLEQAANRWTGRILGDAMFGKAKTHTVKELAEELQFDLARSYAYGDSAQDRWLLGCVGNPAAVNPSRKLARIARKRSWQVMHWNEKRFSPGNSDSHRAQGKPAVTVDPRLDAPEPSPNRRGRIEFCLRSASVVNSGSRS